MTLEELVVEGARQERERDYLQPPHSAEAESAVLGSVLKNRHSIMEVADFIGPDDFYDIRNKAVWAAMLSLLRDDIPIDYHTLADRLQQLGTYERSGGLLYLSDISLAMPTAVFIEHYARIVERTSVHRQLISKAQQIAELAYRDRTEAEETLVKAQELILSVSNKRSDTSELRSIEDVLGDYMEHVEATQEGEGAKYGIPSGYIDLDKLLNGFQRGDLIILAARTGVGKSSLAMNLAVNAATKHNAKIAIWSLEMSEAELGSRLLSMESGVDSPRIRSSHINEQEAHKLDAAMNHLAAASIWVDATPGIPLMELRTRAHRHAVRHGLDLIIVDYLQLVGADQNDRGAQESRVLEVGRITRGLKTMARKLNVSVIALSQLSRATEHRSDHVPQLSDLRESGSIEQDADVVLFIYRDEKYNPDTDKKGVADIIVAKHRNGPTGQVQLLFLERTTKFLDLEVFRAWAS